MLTKIIINGIEILQDDVITFSEKSIQDENSDTVYTILMNLVPKEIRITNLVFNNTNFENTTIEIFRDDVRILNETGFTSGEHGLRMMTGGSRVELSDMLKLEKIIKNS